MFIKVKTEGREIVEVKMLIGPKALDLINEYRKLNNQEPEVMIFSIGFKVPIKVIKLHDGIYLTDNTVIENAIKVVKKTIESECYEEEEI